MVYFFEKNLHLNKKFIKTIFHYAIKEGNYFLTVITLVQVKCNRKAANALC